MSVLAPPLLATPASPPPATPAPRSFYRLSVEQYKRMIAVGILTTEDKIELLDGYLVTKMSPNPPHDTSLNKTTKRLLRLVPAGWTWRGQMPVALAASMPEPDFAVARGTDDDYAQAAPVANQLGIIVEVSDSSLTYDRHEKLAMYAADRIPVYWIVNVPDRRVEVYEQPSGPSPTPGYGVATVYRHGDAVPVVIGGANVGSIAVDDLFP